MLVTDLSRDVAGRFCTRLLALGGAYVVSYPEPRSESHAGARHTATDWLGAYLDPHKWVVAAAGADPVTLHEVVRASDVVVTSFDRGRYLGPLDADGVRELNPGAVQIGRASCRERV